MKLETAYLAGGCFWCTEAIFKRLKGVSSVISGYSGGELKNPTYEQVSSGKTGHAETIKIVFNPTQITFRILLDIFFALHDPTTINQQGYDVGPQYRSVIFYINNLQKNISKEKIGELERTKQFQNKIVTEVKPFKDFYLAEDYHQNFYDKNKDYPYCKVIIDPKVKKLLKNFSQQV